MRDYKERKTGLELLKIIAMFAIVLGHFIDHSNGFTDISSFKNPLVIAEKAIGSMTLFKVNVFILITGFFMIEKKLDFSKVKNKLFPLWRVVFGYSVFIMIVMFFIARPSVFEMAKSFFPILCNRYWFFTNYFVLILLAPIINRAFANISKESYKKVLVVIITCFCVWQTLIPFIKTIDNQKGFSLIWFVTVYIIGGYIKKFGINIINNKLRIPIYLLMAMLFTLYRIVLEVLSSKTGISVNIACYNSIFALVASIALFNFFYHIDIRGKIGNVICYISKSVFAVYLISDNLQIRRILYNKIFHVDKYINNGIKSILSVLIMAAIVFIACLLFDVIRRLIISKFMGKIISNRTSAN